MKDCIDCYWRSVWLLWGLCDKCLAKQHTGVSWTTANATDEPVKIEHSNYGVPTQFDNAGLTNHDAMKVPVFHRF